MKEQKKHHDSFVPEENEDNSLKGSPATDRALGGTTPPEGRAKTGPVDRGLGGSTPPGDD
ncbi:hypothetical protein [uncultured Sunxiuqinia sp.]|uniref:hypothetical protein n=1 Tax=Sunxiuqinia rutila TaxID=1397841 RepID=UPI00260EDF24|nr:hypothetical protein [uncultured Sunxiuqinia sp.]